MKISPLAAGTIHFIGIGGIGMSGIAQLLHNLGYKVQGSDTSSSNYNVERLQNMGVKVFNQHQADNINDTALIVTSTAVDMTTNLEVLQARKLKIPIISRAEMLSEIMRLKSCIAVAGTHGKTTTTCLTATLLDYWGVDPTIANGGIMNAYGTNTRLGYGEWMVVEADESDGSFLKLPADIAIITNIEMEHADFYADKSGLISYFKQFVENIPFYGLGIICYDDPYSRQLIEQIYDRRILTYGLQDGAHLQGINLRSMDNKMVFDVVINNQILSRLKPNHRYHGQNEEIIIRDICLPSIGRHNVSNSLAAIAVAIELNIPSEIISAGLAHFQGVKRRFSLLTRTKEDVTVIDDYAHHPTEVKAVLSSAKIFQTNNEIRQKGRIIGIFQPHRYSRLSSLFDDFAHALAGFDQVIVAPVYCAGEQIIDDFDHEKLAHAINTINSDKAIVVTGLDDLTHKISDYLSAGNQLIFMGAGDITQWAKKIASNLQQNIKINEKKAL